MAKMASLDAENNTLPDEAIEAPVAETVETPAPVTECGKTCDLHDNYCQNCGKFVTA